MIIDTIEIYHCNMPLIEPWRAAYGEDKFIENIIVCMRSGEYCGWGEGSPLRAPTYSSEWAGAVFLAVRDWLAPCLVGKDVESGKQLQGMMSWVKGNYIAKASLDLAWWDLYAKMQGQPLWKLIGGKSPEVIVGADIGILPSVDMLLSRIERAQSDGFERVKLKYRNGWDIPVLTAVREKFPHMVFHIDCNSAYTLDDTPMFRELDRFNLAMIEQPLAHDDLVDHAKLQHSITTPICLDESIVSIEKTRKAIELGSCKFVNVKLGRAGGLSNALIIHNLCMEANIPCWVGGMLESAIGQSHNIALATLPNMKYPNDIFPSSRFYVADLGVPEIRLSGPSRMTATQEPGIGCEPRESCLQEYQLQKAIVC